MTIVVTGALHGSVICLLGCGSGHNTPPRTCSVRYGAAYILSAFELFWCSPPSHLLRIQSAVSRAIAVRSILTRAWAGFPATPFQSFILPDRLTDNPEGLNPRQRQSERPKSPLSDRQVSDAAVPPQGKSPKKLQNRTKTAQTDVPQGSRRI